MREKWWDSTSFFIAMFIACCISAGFLVGYFIGKPINIIWFFVGAGIVYLWQRWFYIRREREMLREIEEMRQKQKSLFERSITNKR